MEQWHKDYILKHYFEDASKRKRRQIDQKVITLSNAAGLVGDINDPYAIEQQEFREILSTIDLSCQKIISLWEGVTS